MKKRDISEEDKNETKASFSVSDDEKLKKKQRQTVKRKMKTLKCKIN